MFKLGIQTLVMVSTATWILACSEGSSDVAGIPAGTSRPGSGSDVANVQIVGTTLEVNPTVSYRWTGAVAHFVPADRPLPSGAKDIAYFSPARGGVQGQVSRLPGPEGATMVAYTTSRMGAESVDITRGSDPSARVDPVPQVSISPLPDGFLGSPLILEAEFPTALRGKIQIRAREGYVLGLPRLSTPPPFRSPIGGGVTGSTGQGSQPAGSGPSPSSNPTPETIHEIRSFADAGDPSLATRAVLSVDVSVTDHRGNPIEDLAREHFFSTGFGKATELEVLSKGLYRLKFEVNSAQGEVNTQDITITMVVNADRKTITFYRHSPASPSGNGSIPSRAAASL